MSDVLPEWGIKLRNLVDRIAPLINEHHSSIHDLEQRIIRLERENAQLRQVAQQQQTTIGMIQARTMGAGATTGEG